MGVLFRKRGNEKTVIGKGFLQILKKIHVVIAEIAMFHVIKPIYTECDSKGRRGAK